MKIIFDFKPTCDGFSLDMNCDLSGDPQYDAFMQKEAFKAIFNKIVENYIIFKN